MIKYFEYFIVICLKIVHIIVCVVTIIYYLRTACTTFSKCTTSNLSKDPYEKENILTLSLNTIEKESKKALEIELLRIRN